MKSKIAAYSCKDGLLSLTVENKELPNTAKKGDSFTIKGLGELDGTYSMWNAAPPNHIQFSHSTNARLSAHEDIPETPVTAGTEATAEWVEQTKHAAR
jgi:hypothetical protein